MDLDQYNEPELPPEQVPVLPDPTRPESPESEAPPEPEQQPLADEPPQNQKPKFTGRRKGKVAQKTKPVRDKINALLLDGTPYLKLIAALGEDGKDLNEDNIGNWHKGGFRDFLASLDRIDALQQTHENAMDLLQEKAAMPVQDASRTVAAAQLYELLQSFDPTSFAAALADKPELYLRLVNALSRLCEGEAATTHRRAQQSLISAKLKSDEPLDQKKLLTEGELKDLTRQVKII